MSEDHKELGLLADELLLDVFAWADWKRRLLELRKKKEFLEEKKKSLEERSLLIGFVFVFVVCFSLLFLYNKDFWSSFWTSLLLTFYPGLVLVGFLAQDRFTNITSGGELRKINTNISEIEVNIKSLSREIDSFETRICDHLQKELDDFFNQNLYRKRSGDKYFEEALSKFAQMVLESSRINKDLVIRRVRLSEYASYIEKRVVNHELNAQRINEGVRYLPNNRVTSTTQKQEKIEITPPENRYRVARKIDNWEEINIKRKLTGLKGEENVVALEQDFLDSIDRRDLSARVRHVSVEDGDGMGYDVLSFFDDGREKYIEVKSTTVSLGTPYYLSRNELAFLQEHPTDAYIYRILLSVNEPRLKIESAIEVLNRNEIIPTQYQVREK